MNSENMLSQVILAIKGFTAPFSVALVSTGQEMLGLDMAPKDI